MHTEAERLKWPRSAAILGAGTQAMLLLLGELIFGKPDVLARALLMGAAWTLNLAVAEWIIRGRPLWPIRLSRAAIRRPLPSPTPRG